MAIGNEIEKRGHIKGFKEEINKAARENKDTFFSWFNAAENVDEAFIRGQWDFLYHIAYPLTRCISYPEKLTALEIGHGGGRVLAAASKSFGRVIGVDIHEENDLVTEELTKRGYGNFALKTGNGCSLPVDDATVDVVYSFIVLQHIEKMAFFEEYVRESFRVLRPGGVAMLYFGRFAKFSGYRHSRILYLVDKLLEGLVFWQGYREIPAAVNDMNLLITLRHAKGVVQKAGFTVLGSYGSRRKIPDGTHIYGLQHGLLLKKPEKAAHPGRL